MTEFWTSLLAWLGLGGITIGGSAAVGFGLFKWLGEKWIVQKFETQLLAYRAEQERELERLRHRINGVFDRTIRLHTKEFETLPELWGKLVEAHAWAQRYLAPLQTYPDVSRMDDEELAEYLAGTTFMEVQKRDITNASPPTKRQELFTRIADMYRHNDAHERLRTFATSLSKEGVFVRPDIKSDMEAMLELISGALLEKRMNQEDKIVPLLRDEYKKFRGQGPDLFKKIENAVADRLWEATKADI